MKFKKEIILLISIIIGIGLLEFITSSFSEKSVKNISSKITPIKDSLYYFMQKKENNELKNEEKDDLTEKIEKLRNDWYKEEDKLSMFVEHNELEKITKSIIVLEENTKNEEYSIALENLTEFKYWLNHFAEKEKLRLKNIL